MPRHLRSAVAALILTVAVTVGIRLSLTDPGAAPSPARAVRLGTVAVTDGWAVGAYAIEVQRAAFVAYLEAHRRPPGSPPDEWWDCIALHEQGGNWHAHSSTYSSALGILNAAIRANAPSPEVAARILSGTATREEQIETADRLYVWAGPGAWSTSRSC